MAALISTDPRGQHLTPGDLFVQAGSFNASSSEIMTRPCVPITSYIRRLISDHEAASQHSGGLQHYIQELSLSSLIFFNFNLFHSWFKLSLKFFINISLRLQWDINCLCWRMTPLNVSVFAWIKTFVSEWWIMMTSFHRYHRWWR